MKKLTDKELEKIKKICEDIEEKVYLDGGWKHHSGGFATCDMFNYDDDFVDLKVKEGIVNDVEDRVYSRQLKIDRKTMEVSE